MLSAGWTLRPLPATVAPHSIDSSRLVPCLLWGEQLQGTELKSSASVDGGATIPITVILGPSGCGKTRVVYQMAERGVQWVMLFDYSNNTLKDYVVQEFAAIGPLQQGNSSSSDRQAEEYAARNTLQEAVFHRLVFAWLLLLDIALQQWPDLSPAEYLRLQLRFPNDLVTATTRLRDINPTALSLHIMLLTSKIHAVRPTCTIVCASDEAQILDHIAHAQVISIVLSPVISDYY